MPQQATGFEATTQLASTQVYDADTQLSNTQAGNESARMQAVQGLVQMMSDFVLLYVPQHSFVILKEIEGISSMEQIAVLLGGYELMVKEAGPITPEHVSQVRRSLQQWM